MKIIDEYRQRGYALTEQREAEEGEDVLDVREIENMKPRSYALEILNKINPNEIKSRLEHMKYRLLSLLVRQPPVRTPSYSTAQMITSDSKIRDDEDFIWVRRAKSSTGQNKVSYVVQKDKVSGARSFSSLADSVIEVEDAELINLFFTSYKK